MGDLPPDRITAARPFSGVGTDFAGPFSIKVSSIRNAKIAKGYLCVFVCLVTKSVHLEVVSSLSTEAFIACLSRFVSRRGLPSLIRSDCGTNFKGSERYLGEVNNFLTENQVPIENSLSRRGIKWKFSPAGYPSWGGIFEAVVKVAKTHLRRIIGESILTFEELATQRVRWIDKTDPPRVGDLVLINEPNMPPLSWRRGRIIKLFPGADGTPRVAEVRVGESVLKRAVAGLSRLPVA
ncbi:unnamed protein product [Pieris macdunnoughi]|uniref:Integrase catalytic domain-containing protein n=1 Tax=Pieris macdunnoughi TaxID=345717 RepID=A0A821XR59_9NEOP|nr:unnamed protein product [Pieris macdunnoughi]